MLSTYEFDPRKFLGKIIIVLGPTESGKTTVVKYLLYLFDRLIPIAWLFSTTNASKREYDGIIPWPLFYPHIEPELLERIYEDQMGKSLLKELGKDVGVLDEIFRCCGRLDGYEKINHAVSKIQSLMESCDDPVAKDACIDKLRKCYGCYFSEHYKEIMEMDSVPDDRKLIVSVMLVSTDVLILYDDCTAELEGNLRNKTLKNLVYQSRHGGVTSIFIGHVQKAFSTEMREGQKIIIFTERSTVKKFFTDNKLGMKKTNKELDDVCSEVFGRDGKSIDNWKLVYLKDEDKFYRFRAETVVTASHFEKTYVDEAGSERKLFGFGSVSILRFLETFKKSKGIDMTNSYIRNLKSHLSSR